MTHPFTELATYVVPGAFALGGLALGLAVRGLVMPLLARIAARTPWRYDDSLVEAVKNPAVIWFALLGLHLAGLRLPFDDETHEALRVAAEVALILSITWAAGHFAVLAVQTATHGGTHRGVSLIANLTRVVVAAIGLLVILDTLGIKITGLLATLGVGGLAVGLALQDTLSNFFAGIRILVGGKIRPGDFIRLENGLEGTVQDITWGQTTVLQPPNNLVLVPNGKLAASITTNFSLPDPAQNFIVPLSVARGSDLDKVEAVTLEVARETARVVEEAVAEFEPKLRFDGFGDSGINVNVVLRARHFDMRGRIVHEFTKRLLVRYRAEGIELATPLRTMITKEPPPSR
jgi:small-conductance mechanosensitive channel